MSHPLRKLTIMSNTTAFTADLNNMAIAELIGVPDPFQDPVEYLARFGLIAELVGEIVYLPSAA